MIVSNTTDSTWAYVERVVSDTQLAISLDTMTSSIRNSIADVKEKITELEKELSDSTNNEALNKLKEIKDTLSKFQT